MLLMAGCCAAILRVFLRMNGKYRTWIPYHSTVRCLATFCYAEALSWRARAEANGEVPVANRGCRRTGVRRGFNSPIRLNDLRTC